MNSPPFTCWNIYSSSWRLKKKKRRVELYSTFQIFEPCNRCRDIWKTIFVILEIQFHHERGLRRRRYFEVFFLERSILWPRKKSASSEPPFRLFYTFVIFLAIFTLSTQAENDLRQELKGEVRDALREKNGIMWEKFPSGGPPTPQFGKPLLSKKKVGFIFHFRTSGTFLVFTKKSPFWAIDWNYVVGIGDPPLRDARFLHFPQKENIVKC